MLYQRLGIFILVIFRNIYLEFVMKILYFLIPFLLYHYLHYTFYHKYIILDHIFIHVIIKVLLFVISIIYPLNNIIKIRIYIYKFYVIHYSLYILLFK